jgi:hypothetical protein
MSCFMLILTLLGIIFVYILQLPIARGKLSTNIMPPPPCKNEHKTWHRRILSWLMWEIDSILLYIVASLCVLELEYMENVLCIVATFCELEPEYILPEWLIYCCLASSDQLFLIMFIKRPSLQRWIDGYRFGSPQAIWEMIDMGRKVCLVTVHQR